MHEKLMLSFFLLLLFICSKPIVCLCNIFSIFYLVICPTMRFTDLLHVEDETRGRKCMLPLCSWVSMLALSSSASAAD